MDSTSPDYILRFSAMWLGLVLATLLVGALAADPLSLDLLFVYAFLGFLGLIGLVLVGLALFGSTGNRRLALFLILVGVLLVIIVTGQVIPKLESIRAA